MNDRFPEELLSALLDGEASAEETARVEAWLAGSAEARDELGEMRRVTELLRSLPVESPGDAFVSAVMRRAERAVLIPSPPAPAASRSWGRGWIVAAGGLAVAAAAVLLLLPALFGPEPADRQLARNEAETREGLPSEVVAARSGSAVERAAGADSSGSGPEGEALSLSNASPPASQPNRGDRPRSSPEFEAPRVTAGAEMRVTGQSGDEDLDRLGRSMQNLANWNAVRVGDVVPYFCPPGDQAAVVRLTVVDVRKAAGDLQVLLAKNSVPPVADEESDRADHKDVRLEIAEQLRELETEEGLLALYVESSDAQLLSALEAIEADEQFVAFELEPPVDLAGVELRGTRGLQSRNNDEETRRYSRMETLGEVVAVNRMLQYKAVQQQSAPRLPEESDGGRSAASGRSARAVAEQDAAKDESDPRVRVRGFADLALEKDSRARGAGAPADASEALLNLNSFQVLAKVSGEPPRFGKASERLQQRVRLQAIQPAPAEAAAPATDTKQTAQIETAPVRVLFIFQGKEDHTQDG